VELKRNLLAGAFLHASRNQPRISVEVGSRFPLARTVSGRLLLAQLSSEERKLTLKEPMPGFLNNQLKKIRKDGFSGAANESFVGLHDLAVLVGRTSLGLAAALAVASILPSKAGLNQTYKLEVLGRCVEEIHQRLGLSRN